MINLIGAIAQILIAIGLVMCAITVLRQDKEIREIKSVIELLASHTNKQTEINRSMVDMIMTLNSISKGEK